MKNTKEYKSTQKFLIGSPRKLRLVVALIKKMKPVDAVSRLPFVGKNAAADLAKVVKSALANARQQGVNDTDLVFKEIQIGEGTRLKRGRAASRGRWHPFKRRMSHIRVVLAEQKVSKVEKVSQVSKEKIQEVKVEEVKKEEKKVVKAKMVKKKGVKKASA